MGIDTRAAIVVGLMRGEFEDQDRLEELLDSGDIASTAPYYDGNSDDSAVVGVTVYWTRSYTPKEIDYDPDAVEAELKAFRLLTGQEGKVYLMPDVS